MTNTNNEPAEDEMVVYSFLEADGSEQKLELLDFKQAWHHAKKNHFQLIERRYKHVSTRIIKSYEKGFMTSRL